MEHGNGTPPPLTDAQYEGMRLASGGVDRARYDSMREDCPDVSHEEFLASQTRECPWPLRLFALVRKVTTAEECAEVFEAAQKRAHPVEYFDGYRYGRDEGLPHRDLMDADEHGVGPYTYTDLRQEGEDHDTIIARAGWRLDE
ncbi:hypothetical protein GCM10010402_00930 [Actinomadura luteofluorescens]|uniref:hypothetical protein n=1 Tax=Actinomadura luteofluorescens TaxID=46163 RepID=UPI0021648BC0|nr:hypothetical protein [Actinomadura glauciflava]MCR3745596.1 hypothetical protein [Actinomadura glauciflava]